MANLIGLLFLAIGFVALFGYLFNVESMFGSRKRLREMYGNTVGTIVHFSLYVVLPILLGLYCIVRKVPLIP